MGDKDIRNRETESKESESNESRAEFKTEMAKTGPEESAGVIPEDAPMIMREIDGRVFTAILHFKKDSKETPQDKIRRMIRSEITEKMRFSG